MELGAGITLFSYRSKLAESFDSGLNDTMVNYVNGKTDVIGKFDSMQSLVRNSFYYIYDNIIELYLWDHMIFFSFIVVEIMIITIGPS